MRFSLPNAAREWFTEEVLVIVMEKENVLLKSLEFLGKNIS